MALLVSSKIMLLPTTTTATATTRREKKKTVYTLSSLSSSFAIRQTRCCRARLRHKGPLLHSLSFFYFLSTVIGIKDNDVVFSSASCLPACLFFFFRLFPSGKSAESNSTTMFFVVVVVFIHRPHASLLLPSSIKAPILK